MTRFLRALRDFRKVYILLILIYLGLAGVLMNNSIRLFFAERSYKEGSVRLQLGYSFLAVREFSKAVDFAPWEVQYHFYLARAYEQMGNRAKSYEEKLKAYKDAEAVYFRTMELNDNNPWYPARLGQVYVRIAAMSTGAVAEEYLQKSFEMVKHSADIARYNPMFLLNYAQYLDRLGKAEEAIEYYQKVLKYDPRMVGAYMPLVKVLLKQEKTKVALMVLQQLIKQSSDNIEKGQDWIKHKRKVNPYDIRLPDREKELEQNYKTLLMGLFEYANLLVQMGEYKTANAYIDRILNLRPGHKGAEGLRKQIKSKQARQ